MNDISLDLRGLKCPLPVLHTRKALPTLLNGQTLIVICTDPMAALDIPHLVQQTSGYELRQEKDEKTLTFYIKRL